MLSASEWSRNQSNMATFVLVDSNGNEVLGLGNTFNVWISKAGASFVSSTATKNEIGRGWYSATFSAYEADTIGPVAISIDHASIVNQNLEYCVGTRVVNAIEFTYTITDDSNNSPIQGATVIFSTNSGMTNIVWSGVTDTFGIARDVNSLKPWLSAGVYFILSVKSGYIFEIDSETVS